MRKSEKYKNALGKVMSWRSSLEKILSEVVSEYDDLPYHGFPLNLARSKLQEAEMWLERAQEEYEGKVEYHVAADKIENYKAVEVALGEDTTSN